MRFYFDTYLAYLAVCLSRVKACETACFALFVVGERKRQCSHAIRYVSKFADIESSNLQYTISQESFPMWSQQHRVWRHRTSPSCPCHVRRGIGYDSAASRSLDYSRRTLCREPAQLPPERYSQFPKSLVVVCRLRFRLWQRCDREGELDGDPSPG